MGSCTYDIDKILDMLQQQHGELCEFPYMPKGQACKSPLIPGKYGFADPKQKLQIRLPPIPSVIEPFIRGKIRAKIEVVKPEGGSALCLKAVSDIWH